MGNPTQNLTTKASVLNPPYTIKFVGVNYSDGGIITGFTQISVSQGVSSIPATGTRYFIGAKTYEVDTHYIKFETGVVYVVLKGRGEPTPGF